MSTLGELRIHLRDERPGEHRTACPECAGAKIRPGDDALAVKIDPDGSSTWVCHRCGWTGGLPAPGRERRQPVTDPRRASIRLSAAKADTAGRSASGVPEVAARLWASRRPITPDIPAGRYLTIRGCAMPPPDGHLAWHPEVYHPAEERPFPALLALVTHTVTGAPMTVHRTFLAPDGGGKARVAKPRLLVKGGDKAGGVVRLWPDEAVTTGLCVAEGLETALTAARGFGLAWACLDAGNLAILPVLPGVEALTIVADHDEAGTRAAEACGRRWVQAGCEVRMWKAAARDADLNDYAREAAA